MTVLGGGGRSPGAFAPGLLEVLLIVAVIWTGWNFMHQPEVPAEGAIKADSPEPGQVSVDLKQLTAVALFGKVQKVEKAPVVKQPAAAPVSVSKLQMKLKGTVLAQDRSIALIEPKPGAKDGVFSMGDSIFPGVYLIAVEAAYIVIDDHGKREKVMMEKSKASSNAFQPAVGAPGTNNPFINAVGTPGTNNPFINAVRAGNASANAPANVASSQAAKAQTNFLNMISMAGLTPHLEGGKVQGLAVNQPVKGSWMDKLGLRKGDVIQSMDSNRVTSVQAAKQAYQAARKIGYITIVIMRDGQQQTLYQAMK